MDDIITRNHNDTAAKYIRNRLRTLSVSYEQIDSEQYRERVISRIQSKFASFVKHCCIEVEENIHRNQINKDSEDFKNDVLGM
jgi:hypothetical protein